jgi:hypothetical protein
MLPLPLRLALLLLLLRRWRGTPGHGTRCLPQLAAAAAAASNPSLPAAVVLRIRPLTGAAAATAAPTDGRHRCRQPVL